MRTLLIFFLFISFCFAQVVADPGNIINVNTSIQVSSIWYSIVGEVSDASAIQFSIQASPGVVETFEIPTGSNSCVGTIENLHIIFSNSSDQITNLYRGNLSLLDTFINSTNQSATSTFPFSTSYQTSFGVITGVPTTYTYAQFPNTFRLGYLQDQNGNFIFITDVVENQFGFNGSVFDYQMILPTNGSNITYYSSIDLTCIAPTRPPTSQGGGGGGGGSGIPIAQPPTEKPIVQPEEPIQPEQKPECQIELFCGEWGECDSEGYRYQSCTDLNECSSIEVFRVEKCPEIPQEKPKEIIPEEVIPVQVKEDIPCLPILLLIALLVLIAWYLRRKKERKK